MFFNIKRFVRLLIFCFLLLMFIVLLTDIKLPLLLSTSPDIFCFDAPPETDLPNMLPEMRDLVNNHRKPIFFIETSCHSFQTGQITLNARQACAIESAAKMNPNSDVYVLLVAQTSVNITSADKILLDLLSYSNIYFRHIPLARYTKETVLEKWYESRVLHSSIYVYSHTSDLLRYLTLWKYGGTYLDLDVIVITALEKLEPNYAGAEDEVDIAAGILNFDQNGTGHKLVEQCLYDLRKNYNPNDWGTNGPGVITRVLKTHCNANNTKEMTSEKCHGFRVYPSTTFYAIPWKKWPLFFDEKLSNQTMKFLMKSKVIHVWNKHSTKEKIKVGSKQPYGIIANKFCPKVYKHAGTYF